MMKTEIRYFKVHPSAAIWRYGQVYTLNLWENDNSIQLDEIINDAIKIYPRVGQPEDLEKVVLKVRFGVGIQKYLADQTGLHDPLGNDKAACKAMLKIDGIIFDSIDDVKLAAPDLWDLITVGYVDEDGNTLTKQITKIDLEHKWAGDE